MSSPSPSEASGKFVAIATKHEMLSAEAARELADEAVKTGNSIADLAAQKSLLDEHQIDIVRTLLRPQDTVPGYDILDVIGIGGMGIVYRARQKNLDRVVALKTVLVSHLADPVVLARFEQEAVAVGKLHHPNIVAGYDFGRHEGRVYFAMELVDGENVKELIDRAGSLDVPTAFGLARQAANGLAHAARMGIVHRDVKPANLLLIEPPDGFSVRPGLKMVKIADFGLAFLIVSDDTRTRVTQTNFTVGSPHYIAPEQLDGKPFDYRADIYSLGVTIYQMLVGATPFHGKTMGELVAQKLGGRFQPISEACPNVGHPAAELVHEMLAKDPNERISDYTELIARMDRVLKQSPTLSVTPATTEGVTTSVRGEITANDVTTAFERSRRLPDLWQRWWFRIALVAGLLVLLSTAFLWSTLPWFVEPPKRNLVVTGWATPLFNGRTLSDWIMSSGGWAPVMDDEGAFVLAGTDGVIRRPLFQTNGDNKTPLEHYRLTFFVRLHEATAIELHFGIHGNQTEAQRSVLRVTPDVVTLGRRIGDLGPLVVEIESPPVPGTAGRARVVSLERQREHWWIFLDDRLVGTLPFDSSPQSPEFRLAVEGGPAWFSDLHVDELSPTAKPSLMPAT